MKIGIIREGKVPIDKRTPLTPAQCAELAEKFPFIEIVVQKSPFRCFKDKEYAELGFQVVEDITECDLLMGIKEVPIDDLIHHKTYLFFSHTIKKQPYNRNLLITILNRKIRLIDYETLTDKKGNRVIAFGRFAGLVGAYNGVIAYGKKHSLFELKPAHKCLDMAEMRKEFSKVKLPPIKIIVTGSGRVTKGAMETLDGMGIEKVTKKQFTDKSFDHPVYVQLGSRDYHSHKETGSFSKKEFYKDPSNFNSSFGDYLKHTDLLIAAAYWSPASPVLFTKDDARREDFKTKVIADITCDIEGSIPSTKKPSTIDNPLYDYNPFTENIEPAFSSSKNITVMAVDNLPNELPRDASESFGRELIDQVLPNMLDQDKDRMIEKATITIDGKLAKRYQYLQDFVDGRE